MEIVVRSGNSIEEYLSDLIALRIKVFGEFPYLYDGSIEYEEKYLQNYLKCQESVVVFVLDGSKVIGASTGIPMIYADPEFQTAYRDCDLSKIFYFGESIVKKEYRGKGFGKIFFNEREKHAQNVTSDLEKTCFCAVVRSEDHPLRPKDYKDLIEYWEKRGYFISKGRVCQFEWKDIDQDFDSFKKLQFYEKSWK